MQESEDALHFEEADLEPQAWDLLLPLKDLLKINSQGFYFFATALPVMS